VQACCCYGAREGVVKWPAVSSCIRWFGTACISVPVVLIRWQECTGTTGVTKSKEANPKSRKLCCLSAILNRFASNTIIRSSRSWAAMIIFSKSEDLFRLRTVFLNMRVRHASKCFIHTKCLFTTSRQRRTWNLHAISIFVYL
jgi:hypothetical protein